MLDAGSHLPQDVSVYKLSNQLGWAQRTFKMINIYFRLFLGLQKLFGLQEWAFMHFTQIF